MWLEYVSMGTGSMERSEISKDFLCLRLQRLRTSSETVSSAGRRTRLIGGCEEDRTSTLINSLEEQNFYFEMKNH